MVLFIYFVESTVQCTYTKNSANLQSLIGGYNQLRYRVVVPARQAIAGVDFIPPVRDYEFGYCCLTHPRRPVCCESLSCTLILIYRMKLSKAVSTLLYFKNIGGKIGITQTKHSLNSVDQKVIGILTRMLYVIVNHRDRMSMDPSTIFHEVRAKLPTLVNCEFM